MSENNVPEQEQELDLNQLMMIRREKLEKLKEDGKNPFEITKFNRTNSAGEIKQITNNLNKKM